MFITFVECFQSAHLKYFHFFPTSTQKNLRADQKEIIDQQISEKIISASYLFLPLSYFNFQRFHTVWIKLQRLSWQKCSRFFIKYLRALNLYFCSISWYCFPWQIEFFAVQNGTFNNQTSFKSNTKIETVWDRNFSSTCTYVVSGEARRNLISEPHSGICWKLHRLCYYWLGIKEIFDKNPNLTVSFSRYNW